MSVETDPLERAYEPFKDRLTLEAFKTKVESLKEKKWNFARASLLYLQAQKCKGCEQNVAMSLLCSCADSMQLVGKRNPHANFKKFFMDYCPETLRNPLSNPPLECIPKEKPSEHYVPPFDEALDYVYENFRCVYAHEGIGRLRLLPKGTGLWKFGDKRKKVNDRYYVTDILNFLDWFMEITKESLYKILLLGTIQHT